LVRQHERVHVIEANDQTPFFILALVGVSSPPFEHYVRGGGELALHTLCIEQSRHFKVLFRQAANMGVRIYTAVAKR
jgi:hypothetical protein